MKFSQWNTRLYFGTWQLSGQFKDLSPSIIESLLRFAYEAGIRRFDTAAVYGVGKVEDMLGRYLPKDTMIVTKIPAMVKPGLKSDTLIEQCYSVDHISRSVETSLKRLNRTSLDVVLLHNWLPHWSSDSMDILRYLRTIKYQGMVSRVGISLPDNFASHLGYEIMNGIDVIEAPYSVNQQWVQEQLQTFRVLDKEVLLRSLFCQGKLLTEHSARDIVVDTLKLNTSVVIGMTTDQQITSNISYLKEVVT
jgi:aryl-alcohol dehydrogenase-like predicted oxidoreductase